MMVINIRMIKVKIMYGTLPELGEHHEDLGDDVSEHHEDLADDVSDRHQILAGNHLMILIA